MSPERPRIAGEIRLRVTSSDDPASFEIGSDLLRPDGLPWSRPLYALSKFYPHIYEKLREDQLVPDDLDRALATFPKARIRYSHSQILYTLNDTVIVDFSVGFPQFIAITEQGMDYLLSSRVFFDFRELYKVPPYKGADTNPHLLIHPGL
jgi:hypothetical protein